MSLNSPTLAGNTKLSSKKELLPPTSFINNRLFWFNCIFIFSLCHALNSFAQTEIFEAINSIPVNFNGKNLPNAWAGGLNAALLNTYDLDNDSIDDLVIYDKTSQKISTFLFKNGKYSYAPSYELYFPKLSYWMQLIDYNCDGKKDIFTSGYFASNIAVYTNTSTADKLSWQLTSDDLTATNSYPELIDIQCAPTDYPSILDIDNDGDMDIISYDGLGKSTLCLYLNHSKEQYNNCDSLVFEKYSACYGKFTIGGSCSNLEILNQGCQGFGGTHDNERVMHNGSSIRVMDINGDGKTDILLGDVGCNSINALYNSGTSLNALVTTVNPSFPAQNPINMHYFPTTFVEDINGDGVKDLLATPNLLENDDLLVDFQNSLWYYINTGTNQEVNYSFSGKNFLQDEMIELGERTFPVLQDYDNDGDKDLLVANRGIWKNGNFVSTIFLFKNVGTKDSAQFVLINDDYLNFSSLLFYDLRIGTAKVDENDSPDLYLMATDTSGRGLVYYIPNSNAAAQPMNFNIQNLQTLNITAFRKPPYNTQIYGSFTKSDYVHIFTYKNELKLLFGTKDGPIQLYKNLYANGVPNFTFELNNFVNTSDSDYTKAVVKAFVYPKSNDSLDVYTTDNTGILTIYKLASLYDTNFTVKQSILLNKEKNTVQPTSLGFAASVAIGDLNNDNSPDLVIGTQAGGLLFFKNAYDASKPPVTVIGASIAELVSQKPFTLFPNPVESILNISSDWELTINIVDMYGRSVAKFNHAKSVQSSQLNVSALQSGIYYLQISTVSHQYFEKIVVEK